uniref:SMC5-SMC6 complex localization factor 1 n=2 Tax=Oryzias latipes TaxID=8090 RepID=A0A3P9LZV7_ORYLA
MLTANPTSVPCCWVSYQHCHQRKSSGRMERCKIFQISGIKNRDKKRVLVKGIQQLGGKYIGGSVYKNVITHLITPQVSPSEKFLAACAAGKWVVTLDYVVDSVKNGSWLPERSYEVAISTASSAAFYPVRQWREKVATGRMTGAFQGWRVLLMVQEPRKRAMFKRLLMAGKAEVYKYPPPSYISITHVMAKPVTDNSKSHNAPCYPVSYIVQHLFQGSHLDVNFNIMKSSYFDFDLSNLEMELKSFVIKKEVRPRFCFLEFLGYHDPYRTHSQATATDFSNVGSMIECGLFDEALDSIKSAVYPGLLPPATYLISFLQYAQQGNATPAFLRSLHQFLSVLLITNPPWLALSTGKKYYIQVLQCPQCKNGLWPFLETAIRYCLFDSATCHPLPGPGLPNLIHFNRDILSLCLKIFQGELHCITSRGFLQGTRASPSSSSSSSSSLLYRTFWTVWERSTLLSHAVKQLAQLLIQAAMVDYSERDENLLLADILLDLLSVLVEFWYQQHFKLNQILVDKGFKDLSEHLVIISQDVSPSVLIELVARVHSSRFRLVMADAMFRNLCCRSGCTLGDEPLSLKKMVLSYLPALRSLAQTPCSAPPRTGPTSYSCAGGGNSCRNQDSLGKETSTEKENIPKGLHKVNAAGETLLHRACKRNQVEKLLQILALPGTDVNVRDHAGWTPLHEACNHGSTECVKVLLQHRPAPFLSNQVGGVSPLHDALLNGHMDIAKMLLEHGGSALFLQTDEEGRVPLDLVSAAAQREELLHSAQVGDSALRNIVAEVLNLPLLEAGACLLGHLIYSYLVERGPPSHTSSSNQLHNLGYKLVRALQRNSLREVTLGWTDQRAVRLMEDVETLLELSKGQNQDLVPPAVKQCKAENTQFLMQILEDLRSRGETLLAYMW